MMIFFLDPIDIGDNTIPNGNAIMLNKFSKIRYDGRSQNYRPVLMDI